MIVLASLHFSKVERVPTFDTGDKMKMLVELSDSSRTREVVLAKLRGEKLNSRVTLQKYARTTWDMAWNLQEHTQELMLP